MALSNEQLIISVDDLRDYTAMSDNFDSEILTACIIRATDLNCQEVLGTALTDKLITDYNANTLTGVYDELYDSSKASVKKMVIWQAYVYGLSRFAFRIQNSGISRSGGNLDTDPITNEDLAILQREARGALSKYENRVKTYLGQNYSDFTELQDNTPEYIKANLKESSTDYGISDTPTRLYNDF